MHSGRAVCLWWTGVADTYGLAVDSRFSSIKLCKLHARMYWVYARLWCYQGLKTQGQGLCYYHHWCKTVLYVDVKVCMGQDSEMARQVDCCWYNHWRWQSEVWVCVASLLDERHSDVVTLCTDHVQHDVGLHWPPSVSCMYSPLALCVCRSASTSTRKLWMNFCKTDLWTMSIDHSVGLLRVHSTV